MGSEIAQMVLDDIPNPLLNLFNSSCGINIDPSTSTMYILEVRADDLGELPLYLVLQLRVFIALSAKAFSVIK